MSEKINFAFVLLLLLLFIGWFLFSLVLSNGNLTLFYLLCMISPIYILIVGFINDWKEFIIAPAIASLIYIFIRIVIILF